jgi:hypothetical protein
LQQVAPAGIHPPSQGTWPEEQLPPPAEPPEPPEPAEPLQSAEESPQVPSPQHTPLLQ